MWICCSFATMPWPLMFVEMGRGATQVIEMQTPLVVCDQMGKTIILLTCSMVFADSKAGKAARNRCGLVMCHLQLCNSSRDAKTF